MSLTVNHRSHKTTSFFLSEESVFYDWWTARVTTTSQPMINSARLFPRLRNKFKWWECSVPPQAKAKPSAAKFQSRGSNPKSNALRNKSPKSWIYVFDIFSLMFGYMALRTIYITFKSVCYILELRKYMPSSALSEYNPIAAEMTLGAHRGRV